MAAAADFFGVDNVPLQAVTMGISTIMNAKEIILMACDERKSGIIADCVEGPLSSVKPASLLQEHSNCQFVIDVATSEKLSRCMCPWAALGESNHLMNWEAGSFMERRAVIWLSLKLEKSILKLVEEDFLNNSLQSLVQQCGPVHHINIRVHTHLAHTVTGWPGGKTSTENAHHVCNTRGLGSPSPLPSGVSNLYDFTPRYHCSNNSSAAEYLHLSSEQIGAQPHFRSTQSESHSCCMNASPSSLQIHSPVSNLSPPVSSSSSASPSPVFSAPKKVLIFSPHPDDDVISMGGTMMRLCDQGHDVHVAYQTSGDNAVWNDEVRRFSWFLCEAGKAFNQPSLEQFQLLDTKINGQLDSTLPGVVPSKEILKMKALMRYSEARSAALYSGVKKENIHFLELPFYETGQVRKNPISDTDVNIVKTLLDELQPQIIFAAGDLSDPHGTHRQCLKAVLKALLQCKHEKNALWFSSCNIWLYRGAWQEWEPHYITMAVPMSPPELLLKRYAIFKHQTQKDVAPFPGRDPREFWVRTEARNRATAKLYDILGLQDYEAIEAFVSFNFDDNNSFLYNCL